MELIYDHNLPAHLQASAMYASPAFEQRVEEFKQYCRLEGIYYYSRPREKFFTSEALELAAAAGCTKVLLEDLS
jgi:hypothetical protein